MSLAAAAIAAFERAPLPDRISRAAIASLVSRTRRRLASSAPDATARFADAMDAFPIALHTDLANRQHYELPPDFFGKILGPQRKYSCCYYDAPGSSLAEAEEAALQRTAANARLADGQAVLELGCGWGSLSLWMASHFPGSRIVSVSNSAPQRRYIEAQAASRGLSNLTVITADMNDFDTDKQFDRIVSVEMFEHMANWRPLLTSARSWLRADGHLFLHVFTHRSTPYRFDPTDRTDWIAQHFFTGGIMPSHGLISQFADLFTLDQDWFWSGEHYARTARDWLALLDADPAGVDAILRPVYGRETRLWHRRWRLFLLATEGLFGHADGTAWGVSHYRLSPSRQAGISA